jgi:diguanylate cyclase (GGDEF)-like protein
MVAQNAIKSIYTYPKILAAKEKFSSNSIKVLKLSIEDSLNKLLSNTKDYAYWDDMYDAFSLSAEEKYEFINENFIPNTFKNLDLDYVGIFDRNNKLFWDGLLTDFDEKLKIEKNQLGNFDNKFPKLMKFDTETPLESFDGLYSHQGDDYLFSIALIKKSDTTGVPRGYLVFGKKIDIDYIESLGYRNNMEIEYIKSSQYKFKKIVSKIEASKKGYYYDSNNSHYIFYKDINGKPIFALKFNFYDGINIKDISTRKEDLINIIIAFFIMTLLYKLSKRKTVDPIKNLNEHIKSIINTSEFSELEPANSTSEVNDLIVSFNKLVKKINFQNKQIENINEYMNQLAYIDPLTKINNRRRLEEQFDEYVLMSRRNNTSIGIILCDIDYFKNYNDYYGHVLGDNSLVEVANVLSESCQDNEFSNAFRYGGEEFVILMYDTDTVKLEKQIKTIQKGIANLDIEHQASKVSNVITITFGAIRVTANENIQLNTTLNKADEVLYRAKKAGRNRYIIG